MMVVEAVIMLYLMKSVISIIKCVPVLKVPL